MLNSTNLIVAIVVIVVALAGLAAVGFLMQRRKRPQVRPEVDLDTAWGAWFGDGDHWSDRDRKAVQRLQGRGDTAAEELKTVISATVDHALATPEPTVELRRAIMDAADHAVLAETICAGVDGTLDASDSVVTIGVLRCYSKMRFHDYATEDWYAHYLQIAEMNANNVAAMVRKTVGHNAGEDAGDAAGDMEAALHDPLSRTMRQVRERLLRYPPRTAVTRGEELTDPHVQQRLHPSQKQVDLLTSTMKKRFDKLFAGQVYNLRQAPPVNPVGAFQIDAGLLYALLASYFRHPRDAWRKIMGEALGSHKGAMQNEDALFERATNLARVWSGAPEGALTAAMQFSWSLAFEPVDATSGSSVQVDEPAVVAGMVEHAGPLVGAIRDVIEKN